MTFEYRDHTGDHLNVRPVLSSDGPGIAVEINDCAPVHIPLDRVEEVVAGIRDVARQAAGQQPAAERRRAQLATPCAYCGHTNNWHALQGGCQVTAGEAGCGCRAFVTPAVGQQPDACPTPETHNWGCGCPTDQRPAHARAETEAILHDAMTHGVVDETVREKLIAQHREAVARETAVGQQPTQQPATDLPERLAAILTERFTALGNPFSGMRINFQSPDEWPASREVSPNDVAEVLRDLLADGPAS